MSTPPPRNSDTVETARLSRHSFLRIAAFGLGALSVIYTANAQTAAKWNVPASAAGKKNPLAGNADAVAAGKQIFTTTCVPCHGSAGRGDGPAAVALNPKPANYTTSAISAESDGSLFWKLSEGRGAMLGFKATLSEKQRWELISYIRTLQGKK
jgi:mono/diheme cytochrome c family protein